VREGPASDTGLPPELLNRTLRFISTDSALLNTHELFDISKVVVSPKTSLVAHAHSAFWTSALCLALPSAPTRDLKERRAQEAPQVFSSRSPSSVSVKITREQLNRDLIARRGRSGIVASVGRSGPCLCHRSPAFTAGTRGITPQVRGPRLIISGPSARSRVQDLEVQTGPSSFHWLYGIRGAKYGLQTGLDHLSR